MIFLKLLFNIILLYNISIFIGAVASLSEENSRNNTAIAYRLPDYITPYHYRIRIEFLPPYIVEITHFYGICHIYIKINQPTHNISLHAQKPQIKINDAVLKNNASSKEELVYVPQNKTYHNESHILVFHFSEEIPSGDYFFIMTFTGALKDNKSIYKYSYINSAENRIWLYTTHFQAIGARQIFPCWDEPKFKATFNFSIKYREEYMVLSNMNYQTILNFDNIQMMLISTTPEISTYHVAFCLLTDEWFKFTSSIKYDDDDDDNTDNDILDLSQLIPLNRHKTRSIEQNRRKSQSIERNRHESQISFAKKTFGKVVTCFINDWENKKQISKVQFVLIPGLLHNVIEKWGLVFYRETALIYEKKIDSLSHKIEVACLIARQIAYQLFGITVSPSWWSYHWLNQGIATLLGIDILHKTLADFRTSDLFVVQMQHESLRLDGYYIMKPLISQINKPTEINSLFSFSYYSKAPAILRMLQYVLTDDIFKKGIEKFYKTHMFRSVALHNFYNDMQIVYEERKQSHMKPFIIKEMMNAWTRQNRYPTLRVKRKLTEKNTSFLIIEKDYYFLDMKYDWWIPITITKQTEPDFRISANWHGYDEEWMKYSSSNYFEPYLRNFSVEEDEWYIVNIQQMGYYRVNYELKNWKNIARYLNSAEYTNIHVLNRAQIIDDVYHFVMRDALKFSIFFKVTEYLSRETDYVAWYPMFKALEDISRMFPFPDKKINNFKTKILNSLNGLLQNIGYNKKPNEKTDDLIDCLRQEATKWACILGEPSCVKAAETKLHQHLTSPKRNKLLPWWRHWTFCNGLMRANSSIWDKVWSKHIENPNVITSKFLACSNNSATIIKYTETLFNNFNKEMKDNYLNDIFHINAKHANNNETLDNILRNLKKIPREYIIATLVDIINHVYSEKQLNQIKQFVDINEKLTIEHMSELLFKLLKINYVTEVRKLVLLIYQKITRRKSEISKFQTFVEFTEDYNM